MGGEGSGRKPDPVKQFYPVRANLASRGNANLELPNLGAAGKNPVVLNDLQNNISGAYLKLDCSNSPLTGESLVLQKNFNGEMFIATNNTSNGNLAQSQLGVQNDAGDYLITAIAGSAAGSVPGLGYIQHSHATAPLAVYVNSGDFEIVKGQIGGAVTVNAVFNPNGQLQLPLSGANTGVLIGGNAQLFTSGNKLYIQNTSGAALFPNATSEASAVFIGTDVPLWRNAANTLTISGAVVITSSSNNPLILRSRGNAANIDIDSTTSNTALRFNANGTLKWFIGRINSDNTFVFTEQGVQTPITLMPGGQVKLNSCNSSAKTLQIGTSADMWASGGNLNLSGSLIIASGSNLTLNSGSQTISRGDFTMASGNALISAGDLNVNGGNIQTAGNITISPAGNKLIFGASSTGLIYTSGSHFVVEAGGVNKNILFYTNDGGTVKNTVSINSSQQLNVNGLVSGATLKASNGATGNFTSLSGQNIIVSGGIIISITGP